MKAWFQTDIMKLEMRGVECPIAQGGQVQVKLQATGICGSDLHYLEHGRIGDYVVEYPFILGHESAGIVTAVGEGVTSLKIGDRVALEPGCPCGICEFCRSGRYNLCPDVIFFATPPYHGTLAEYVVHPADMCFRLPDSVSSLEGALVEPLAVGFHAAMQGGARIGQTAMVIGCGCIGLVTLLALKSMGVSRVFLSDVIDVRIQKAVELGAERVFDAKREEVETALLDMTQGAGVDLVIETAGTARTQAQCVQLVKRGGTIVYVGMSSGGTAALDLNALIGKEATVKTVFRYRNLYPAAIAAVADGLPLHSILSDVMPFGRAGEAFVNNIQHKDSIVKMALEY